MRSRVVWPEGRVTVSKMAQLFIRPFNPKNRGLSYHEPGQMSPVNLCVSWGRKRPSCGLPISKPLDVAWVLSCGFPVGPESRSCGFPVQPWRSAAFAWLKAVVVSPNAAIIAATKKICLFISLSTQAIIQVIIRLAPFKGVLSYPNIVYSMPRGQ